jgi:hypothetical protein
VQHFAGTPPEHEARGSAGCGALLLVMVAAALIAWLFK